MDKVLVGIVMGSDSDLPVMREAAEILDQLGVGYELVISSAHRAPEKSSSYAKEAIANGLQVIIAGAGGAAHLPGVIAAYTALPVIGVPIRTGALEGVDALYAIVQMPAGIPVAAVAINGAKNAGILAAQILAVKDESLRKRIEEYKRGLAEGVEKKDRSLKTLGIEEYLRTKK
ncbi:MAG: 5-(carboxyamino)imidazole ribonucleotide mutase [Peptococcaceae bacterium]|nr:5-(carboxyamino)imidazole ribonucleotide mutase [Peptococcaceae bacterium]